MATSGRKSSEPDRTKLTTAKPDGTQAIRRAAHILRTIAKAGADGASLTDLIRSEGLPRSTTHRILKGLVSEGLLELSGTNRSYQMGPLIHELSLIPMSSAIEVAHWRHAVENVARRTGVTAYLMRRSGIEAVCLVKADGNSIVRFVPVEVGQRRLLGVGAGATALLAALAPIPCEEIIKRISDGLQAYPSITPESLREAVDRTRRTGFAVSIGAVVKDGVGIGAIIPDPAGKPHLAISIAAHRSTVRDNSIDAWQQVIADEIRASLSTRP